MYHHQNSINKIYTSHLSTVHLCYPSFIHLEMLCFVIIIIIIILYSTYMYNYFIFINYANIIFYKLSKLLLLTLHVFHIIYVTQHYVCRVHDLYLPMQLSTFLFYTFVISLLIATVINPNM